MKDLILVTGGCGYIGSHTVIKLIENDFDVIIADDLSNSTIKTIDRIENITKVRPVFINIDFKEEDKVNALFQDFHKIAAVIHFAAHKAVGESVQNPLMYYQNNLTGLINLLVCAQKHHVNNLIFSSSATVYGTPEILPITEKNKTQRPFSPYGNSKKIAEEIIEDLTIASKDFSALSLRYFNPIGAHKSGLIGELPTGIPNNLMPYITQTAIGLREKLMCLTPALVHPMTCCVEIMPKPTTTSCIAHRCFMTPTHGPLVLEFATSSTKNPQWLMAAKF